jgi:hypothetical protein
VIDLASMLPPVLLIAAIVLALSKPGVLAVGETKLSTHLVVSIVILGGGLYVVLSRAYTAGEARWAYGALGTITGYWLKRSN